MNLSIRCGALRPASRRS